MDELDRQREVITRQAERIRELEADNRQLVEALIKALTLLDKVAGHPVIISSAPPSATTPGFSFTEAFESIRRGAQKMGNNGG